MSVADLLVEIGTEELPPKALLSLSRAFSAGVAEGLRGAGLDFGEVRDYATPRRLALTIDGLQLQAADQSVEALGPSADQAKDDKGEWTAAARGFAGKQGVQPEQLETVETPKGPRLAYRSVAAGIRATDCLGDVVNSAVRALPVPRQMRWGAGRHEFVRPVHWVVALLGDEVIDCEVLGHRAGRLSRGHRFHAPGDISIDAAKSYPALLQSAHVVASFEARREQIREQVNAQARAISDEMKAISAATAVIGDDLLDEVTALVEWPVALRGSFEARFLEVPAEALISSMKSHQKYFHLVDDKGALLPHFITVANLESGDPEQVVAGNERVIRPRLSDADFFYRSDRKRTLASRVDDLGNIVFQQKLGTLLDKTKRLKKLAEALAEHTGADGKAVRRAAKLSKADLTTQMVGEFADMQGIAGRHYALGDGEDPAVADALEQQYWPRFAGDRLPSGPVATALALADRLDTIVGIFGIGQSPSGSRDPFGLRRASLGALRMLVEGEIEVDLRWALKKAEKRYQKQHGKDALQADTVERAMAYMVERFRAWYEDESIAAEVFNAVAAKNLSVPLDIHRRVRAVHAFTRLPEAAALAAANKRVSNILEKQAEEMKAAGKKAKEVSKDLLKEPAEKALNKMLGKLKAQRTYKALATQDPKMLKEKEYKELLASLAQLQDPVGRFFDDVMVMADDEELRMNRLNLLRSLRGLFQQVADISLLAIERQEGPD